MLLGTVSQLTSAIIPPILGHAFGLFSVRERAYRVFFLCAAAIHAVSVTLYFLIDPVAEHARVREAAAEARARATDTEAAGTGDDTSDEKGRRSGGGSGGSGGSGRGSGGGQGGSRQAWKRRLPGLLGRLVSPREWNRFWLWSLGIAVLVVTAFVPTGSAH